MTESYNPKNHRSIIKALADRRPLNPSLSNDERTFFLLRELTESKLDIGFDHTADDGWIGYINRRLNLIGLDYASVAANTFGNLIILLWLTAWDNHLLKRDRG